MRKPVRASMMAALSVLLGTLALGCGDPTGTTTSGQGGSGGGTGGAGGQAGNGTGGSGGTMMGCTNGATQPCYSGPAGTQGMGLCVGGTQTCAEGKWGACTGEVLPATEACNGTDDDCNGQVDDGFQSITCGKGACQVMVDGCVGGMVPPCTPGDPVAETCDGTDEDCNGQIDDGINCPCPTDGEMRSCYSGGAGTVGVGECKSGSQTCMSGAWGPCEGEVLPGMEACDGKDNDCDGMSDENIPKVTCGAGACLVTVEGCVNGVPPTCTPGQPKPETCNGIDDDCDFFIDNGLGVLNCGVGACAMTVPACSGGMAQNCTPGTPMTEVCDGIDNNCNGSTDEGNPGGGGTCNSGMQGVCSVGTVNCVNGATTCIPNSMPTNEICDGKDNNCNGMIDDGNPGGGQACNTGGIGICALGTSACENGAITCKATTLPMPETCDGLDNNCNGATDEQTGGAPCNVPGKVGPCATGATSCVNGNFTCMQTVFPAPETCNNIDDNCSGQIDEGNPGGGGTCSVSGQLGVCAVGTQVCMNGGLACQQVNNPMTEVCGDNDDDDCDGMSDELAHSVCQNGANLPTNCSGAFSTCPNSICSLSPFLAYCCTSTWDNACAAEADFACGSNCCAHNVCTTGAPLANGCSSCVTSMCAAKPSCCAPNGGWTEVCRDRVPKYCSGQQVNLSCGSGCTHSVCDTGANLTTTCNACVNAICATMPSCCAAGSASWTAACVAQVATKCVPLDANWACP